MTRSTNQLTRGLGAALIIAALGLSALPACEGGKGRDRPGTKISRVEIRPADPAPAGTATAPAGAPGEGEAEAFRHMELDALEGTVVLVTHPLPDVLRAMNALVEAKVLTGERLHVVGLYHAAEREEAYARSRTLVQLQNQPWLHLHRLSCRLRPEQIFADNDCTPVFRGLVNKASGIIFTGGADIPPALYGQKTRLTTVIRTPRRHWWELSLLAHLLGGQRSPGLKPLLAERPHVAVLGICLGMQTMNVATGGTLHQDIPSDLYKVTTFEDAARLKPDQIHRSVEHALTPGPAVHAGVYHPIRFRAAVGKPWAALVPDAEPVKVISVHHQALDSLGQGLEVIATSLDGKVVEAVRHKTFAGVLGVQFHPEYFFLDLATHGKARSLGHARGKRLISELVAEPLMGDPRAQSFHRTIWQRFSAQMARSN